MVTKRDIKRYAIIFFLFAFLLPSIFPSASVSAKAKTAYVDIQSGVLNVRSGPGTKYKVVATVKNSTKLTIYSQTKGWSKTKVGKKNGYVSNEFLRFYKKMSQAQAKQISNKAISTLRNIRYDRSYTKKQVHNALKPSFTKGYINKIIKYDMETAGKDRAGNVLYGTRATDAPYYLILFKPDWKKEYTNKPPTVKYYTKNGKDYLKIYHKFSTDMYDHDIRLSLVKSSAKDSWKIYNYWW